MAHRRVGLAAVPAMDRACPGRLRGSIEEVARDASLRRPHKVRPPVHEGAKPLNKPMMAWFVDRYLARPEDIRNPLIDLVDAPNLEGLPPTTIVTTEIDPLRSEGMPSPSG